MRGKRRLNKIKRRVEKELQCSSLTITKIAISADPIVEGAAVIVFSPRPDPKSAIVVNALINRCK